MIDLKALASTSWISSGTERKMSSTKPIGALTHQGEVARATPKATPSSVPASTAQKVTASVMPAPFSMNHRSFSEKEVSSSEENIGQPSSVTEQPPRHQAGRQRDELGDQVIDDRGEGEDTRRCGTSWTFSSWVTPVRSLFSPTTTPSEVIRIAHTIWLVIG